MRPTCCRYCRKYRAPGRWPELSRWPPPLPLSHTSCPPLCVCAHSPVPCRLRPASVWLATLDPRPSRVVEEVLRTRSEPRLTILDNGVCALVRNSATKLVGITSPANMQTRVALAPLTALPHARPSLPVTPRDHTPAHPLVSAAQPPRSDRTQPGGGRDQISVKFLQSP